ncbi:glycosyltransferase family 8 protein [Pontibacter toksunensis]|uniref:Glycosyltransferase family 8 protein n=1 Tax=Pontibacter toksunensis TaxID=1332631 RepID=A0ABW6BZF8_9BACT
MNIAFCINHFGMIGLGTTVLSLLRNCSQPEKLVLWFLCEGLSNEDKMQIKKLLLKEDYKGSYRFIDFSPSTVFGSLNSLHGDWTAYGRLLLADFIDEDQVLYLDSDLVVELDVLKELVVFDFQGQPLAAVSSGFFKYTLGNRFYTGKVGLSPDLEYFNSGVLLINLKDWRLRSVKEECFNIAKKFAMNLPSHDQSLLNIYCAGHFAKLPRSFNCEWPSHRPKPNVSDNMIFHFVGSPKPWDPLGRLIHNGYQTWMKYTDQEWLNYFTPVKISNLKRLWNLRRSYTRCILNKFNI